uniref:Uncharacterized protein n=1 Tax=Chromera velia CCMP2878 TaxID=1169474 RepID=A0A0G4H0J5_9ALVE|eukprot:Cvel_24121.t1-p1 / transcript=Cvel_24121.t1 / gene=Cvel_24121 / organism=Chromera_velia_CCMP2878 / gene_product=hypothetical protein / transcript_product=hypothetical protein / location=Cvel_scaffold2570:24441-26442(+) / protein_length=170 / sequence_SO=supercontig / SO=protein_coding / is_pseudo=false
MMSAASKDDPSESVAREWPNLSDVYENTRIGDKYSLKERVFEIKRRMLANRREALRQQRDMSLLHRCHNADSYINEIAKAFQHAMDVLESIFDRNCHLLRMHVNNLNAELTEEHKVLSAWMTSQLQTAQSATSHALDLASQLQPMTYPLLDPDTVYQRALLRNHLSDDTS